MLVLALLLVALGPFGSWVMPFPLRLADWLLFAGGGYLCFRPVIGAARVVAAHTPLPIAVAAGLACAVAAMPTTLLVAWAIAGMGWTRLPLRDLAGLYPQVLLVGALATAVQFALAREPVAGPEPFVAPDPPAPESPRGAPFLDRLPPALGRDLIALENEDHYVRAHTALGSTLILMRMGDAVAELAAIDGARVHRSWWVARAAVAEVRRRDRAVSLFLANGLEVPVARSTAPELRDAGWL